MKSILNFKSGIVLLTAVAALWAGNAVAQDPSVALSDELGTPGDTVEVSFTFVSEGTTSAGFQFVMSDETAFSDIDLSDCLEGHNATIASCVIPGSAPDTVRITLANDSETPLVDFVGTIRFTIDGGAAPGSTVDLEWDTDFTNTAPDADVDHTNGAIEILDTPPDELSELTVTPDPLDFGTEDLGNMPQQGVITASNTGGSESSLTISSAAYSGDAEFTIVSNACEGATLTAGQSCEVTVEFDAAAEGDFSGVVDFASDADSNPNPSVSVLGSAASVASLSINPPSGNVNIGSGLQGDTLSTSAVISNNGSADGSFDCTLDDPSGVFSASPLSGDVAAGDQSSIELSCSLPADAEDGDSFSATFSCTGTEDFSSEHELSCTVSEFEPLPVPTMQNWSLILFALMMLLAGGLSIRFFRS